MSTENAHVEGSDTVNESNALDITDAERAEFDTLMAEAAENVDPDETMEERRLRILELHFTRAMALMDRFLDDSGRDELSGIMTSFIKVTENAAPGFMADLKEMSSEMELAREQEAAESH